MASEPIFRAGDLVRPLRIRRHPRARAMRLAVDARDGTVWLTLPPRASVARGVAWVEEKRSWIETALGRVPPVNSLTHGAEIMVDGEMRQIDWNEVRPRRVRLVDRRVEVGGPCDAVERRVLAWLRRTALETLARESRVMADSEAITIGAVHAGDPRSRWASCSASGDLRYSWRLVMAPPEVRRSVIAHELAHRFHMNHSPAFHRAVTRLFGRAPTAERRWLAQHGADLHRVGRTD